MYDLLFMRFVADCCKEAMHFVQTGQRDRAVKTLRELRAHASVASLGSYVATRIDEVIAEVLRERP